MTFDGTSRDRKPTGERLGVGVIGVGSMGRNHARVYSELLDVDLVGVADADPDVATSVADRYGTVPMSTNELLADVDAVSVAVPTPSHYETVLGCIDHDVDVLVEKPFVHDPDRGRTLASRAERAGIILQVGHIERFNPAVQTLAEIVPDLEVLAVDATRLGPPIGRAVDQSAVFDLMIHDLDILLSLFGEAPRDISAVGTDGNRLTTAICRFGEVVASLTASRVTQQKVRHLGITARECRVHVDYIDQSVDIYRQSRPKYVESDGEIRHQVEYVLERPTVENGEPLKHELESFVTAVRDETEPAVTAEDGIQAVEVARQIDSIAMGPMEVAP